MDKFKGKVWVFGDNVDTDQIIPAERLVAANLDHLNDYIFEKVRPGFAQQVQKGDILVAGRNFGCGSSREHAPLSLIEAGFSCIIAESETIEVDPDNGKVIAEGKEYSFPEYPPFISELVKAGGLMNLIREGRF